jgi:hypothetical protein
VSRAWSKDCSKRASDDIAGAKILTTIETRELDKGCRLWFPRPHSRLWYSNFNSLASCYREAAFLKADLPKTRPLPEIFRVHG